MKDTDYPALYRAADSASVKAQSDFLATVKWQSLLLIFGAILALISLKSHIFAIIAALVFLGSLFLYIFSHTKQLQAKWYQARALAESIKTSTWRFIMEVEPFGSSDTLEVACNEFRNLLKELLSENKVIGDYLAGNISAEEQITPTMQRIRNSDIEDKKAYYLKHRIDEQQSWYAKKSSENKNSAKNWFIGLCFLYGMAIVCLIIRVAFPDLLYIPIEVFAVSASCALTWIQLKRFGELSSAYGLTAQEIGIIKSRFDEVTDTAALAAFVSDAENAFSREHTQWAARRDH